ncbi:hypothetical protein DVH24_027443 [Malus domestica]|uniref:Uncharacterized protein n=1 Tax=Malus domestica TaxID=3750 RepID=A0A498HE41_MALDO|nr:hypothetical protein DVH24_027443 [Malus domestica]
MDVAQTLGFIVGFTLFQDPSGFVHQHLAPSVGIDTKSYVDLINVHRESAKTQEPKAFPKNPRSHFPSQSVAHENQNKKRKRKKRRLFHKALPFSSIVVPSFPLYFCVFLPASILRVSLLLFVSSSAQEPLVNLVSLASFDGGQDFVMEEMNDGGQLDLEYDFYSETCPETETIVRSTMTQITLTRRMSLLRCCASSSMTASFRSHSWISEAADFGFATTIFPYLGFISDVLILRNQQNVAYR